MQKIIIFLGIGFLCLSFGAVWAQIDNDASPKWAESAIKVVKDAGIMTGFGDGTFRAYASLNRAEAVTLVLRLKDIDPTAITDLSSFPDVPDDAWYTPAIIWANRQNYITGHDDGYFYPGDPINRAEFAALIARSFSLESSTTMTNFADIDTDSWYASFVSALNAHGLIRSSSRRTLYRPENNITRAEAAWTMATMLNKPGVIREKSQAPSIEVAERFRRVGRRVAIKPKNFNSEKQGVDAQRQGLYFRADPTPLTPILTPNDQWVSLGVIRLTNHMSHSGELTSMTLRCAFDKNNIGPMANLNLRLTMLGKSWEFPVSNTGEVLFSGLEKSLRPSEEVVIRVSIKADPAKNYYANDGQGNVFLYNADGIFYEARTNASSNYSVSGSRPAPVEFQSRQLANFDFYYDPSSIVTK